MAEEKKATAKVIVPAKAEVKAEVKKVEAPAKKAPAKKAPAKKAAAAKTTTAKAAAVKAEAAKAEVKKEVVKKETVKKAPAKKAAKAPAKKAEVKTTATVNFEFAGKSYTPDDLLNIAKDVWKYDLNGKAADFKTVELYVKPEESTAYYVINGDVTGSFFI